MRLTFERPALHHRAAFADWIDAWRGDAYDAYRWIFTPAWTDFAWYVGLCERMRTEGRPPDLPVPLEAWWAFDAGTFVGELYVFYQPLGGDNHIGYKVRPSHRRRGIATALLRFGLDRLAQRGIAEALLRCRDTNVASAAVIERAGGTRCDDARGSDGALIRRYVVPTGAERGSPPPPPG